MADELILLDNHATIIEVQDPRNGAPTELVLGGEQGLPGPPGPEGPTGGLFSEHLEEITITAAHLLAGGVQLGATPNDPAKVQVYVYAGIHQRPNQDFVVLGDFLDWSSLALQLLLEEGSVLVVRYLEDNP